jgi:Holliday junction resolvase
MGANASKRGAAYERELVNYLRDAGYGALRLPSSGSATERELPDVLTGHPDLNGSSLLAIEVKSGSASTLYVEKSEVDALGSFARTWGATPYLAARRTSRGTDTKHYLVAPSDARQTPSGNYGLPSADVAERASIVIGPEGIQR